MINDRTMLPIRFIAESFKFNVDWDGKTQTITITKSDEVSDNPAMQPTEHGKVLVVYDGVHHGYYQLGKKVGNAFSDGAKLK